MELVDQFAAAILGGLIAAQGNHSMEDVRTDCESAYWAAEIMLEVRAQRRGGGGGDGDRTG